jgi:hypothetical protein
MTGIIGRRELLTALGGAAAMPAYCAKSWQASRAVNCRAAGIKPHGLRETPGALDRTLLCRSRTRRLIKIERGFHASGMSEEEITSSGRTAMKQDSNAKVRRDLLRALGAGASSAQVSEAQAYSENNDEKRKARYQADSADVKAFYRVNNYPK